MAQGSIAATRSARALIAGLLAAVLVLLASGCAGGAPGTVAYVGDSRITQSQLDTALAGVQETLQEGQQVSPSAVVNVMIQGLIARQIADRNNVSLTDAQRNKLVGASELASLLTVPEAKSIAYDLADSQLVATAVGADIYLRDVQATTVELNPRFGVLDPANKTIVDGVSSSLSLPADTTTP